MVRSKRERIACEFFRTDSPEPSGRNVPTAGAQARASNNPAGVILETISSTLTYALMIPVAVLTGMWLMVSWGEGGFAAMREVLPFFFVAAFLWPFSARLMVAWAATLALAIWGYRSDSTGPRVASLAATMVIWVLVPWI